MKRTDLLSVTGIYRISRCMRCLFACLAIFFLTISADHKDDEVISLTVQNQPLSSVLRQLSEITGYTFIYDKGWADLNITARVQNVSLDKTLRKILNNFNFTILYQEDGNVRIKLYEHTSDDSSYTPANTGGSGYLQTNIRSESFEEENHVIGSAPEADAGESDSEILEKSADDKDGDTESDDKEGAGSQAEQVGETESGGEEAAGGENEQAIEEDSDPDDQETEGDEENTGGSQETDSETSTNLNSDN